MNRFAFILLPLALAACNEQTAGEAATRTEISGGNSSEAAEGETTTRWQSDCNDITFEGADFTHCVADPAEHKVSLALLGKAGAPMRSLATLAAERGANALPVAFAMNGGMYDDDGEPIGYYVQSGKRTQELSRSDGPGNFHLLPNGVFFGTGGKWEVRATEDFYANVSDRPDFGTQSGPMLVIDGKLHPEITQNGPSRKVRNAVGVDARGRAHFVISDGNISFGVIARLFRDELKTPNALFLDGAVSSLWDPATGRLDSAASIGPMIVVEKREDGSGAGGTR